MKNVWRLMIGCVLLSLFSSVRAQKIFNLTAEEVRIDSLLPVFSYQMPLGRYYADSLWQVSIDYPLFEDMTKDEIRRYQQVSGAPLPEMPEVTQTIVMPQMVRMAASIQSFICFMNCIIAII